VRVLPDSPNLDFLRQQAKDLLAALRESMPRTSLTDAQRHLAAQYGFDSWTALRTEVEQRQQRSPDVPDGLAEALASAFGLGPVQSLRPVSYTPMGRVWSLTTAEGRWLAVPGYPWMSEEQAEIGVQLQTAAGAVGIASPMLRRSRVGRLVASIGGTPWRIAGWMELGPSPITPVPATLARRIGEIAGTLHTLAISSDAAINPYLMHRHSESEWRQLLHRAHAADRPWADRLDEQLPVLADLGAIGTTTTPGDLILCNSNLIPENVRMGPKGEVIVLEWTFTGALTAELEVASLLTHWAMRPRLNRIAASAFAEGYTEVAGAFPRLTLDSFGVAVSGYLNWTYNTLCEAIDPEHPDAADFTRRETADLLGNPMTPVALGQLIDATSIRSGAATRS